MKKLIPGILGLLLLMAGVPSISGAARDIPDFAVLAENLKPAVVNISTSKTTRSSRPDFPGTPGPYNDKFEEFFDRFFRTRPDQPQTERSLGSGFIISADGFILTNQHLVKAADEIKVLLADGRIFNGTVQGGDGELDLALIRIDIGKERLPVISMGDSDQLRVGEWVMAIGNPFGLQQTVTVGIVSAKERVLGAGAYDSFIQTDASINPGNSGGPLFNSRGQVVGINTAIVAGGQGIGFAIPINAARAILPQLRETGRVVRGWLGVSVQTLTEELAASFGHPDTQGALVTEVAKGSPAAEAGIRRGDIILAINGQLLPGINDLPRQVAVLPIGAQARITIFRGGGSRDLTAKIGRLDGEEEQSLAETVTETGPGLSLGDISPEAARYFGLADNQGALVTAVAGGPAAAAGLRAGDLIIEVDDRQIRNAAALWPLIEEGRPGEVLRLLVRRRDRLFYTTLELGPG
jgi:serine protease Do